jgi:predicted SPOUT superfamily RNA methylase MTH1
MNLSIAIPDSSLLDESTILNKTKKISTMARTCAIFKVNQIFIYEDGKQNKNDSALLSTSLKYLETPQYFRKEIFPKTQLLKYAGVLQPLNISSHLTTSNQKMIKIGDIRDALIINYKGKKFLDIGINKYIQYFGKIKSGTRIAIQIKTTQPELTAKEISRDDIKDYWGYNVKERSNLLSVLSAWKGKIILTSKKGKNFSRLDVKKITGPDEPILIVFGTTNKGVYDILGSNIKKIQNANVFNFFPNQGTQTVRLEEAILGTLSIINILIHNYDEK